MMRIDHATIADTDGVWHIVKNCADWLAESGHRHWKDYYSREKVEKKIKTGSVYVSYKDRAIIATVSLSEDRGYLGPDQIAQFNNPEGRALYISMLAVDPHIQKQGVASMLLQFAEEEAKRREIHFLRFDCKASIAELVTFYIKRGYKQMGQFVDTSANEIYLLMEKTI